jgi:hypothetical protein
VTAAERLSSVAGRRDPASVRDLVCGVTVDLIDWNTGSRFTFGV